MRYIVVEGYGKPEEAEKNLIEDWEEEGIHPSDRAEFEKDKNRSKKTRILPYAGASYPLKILKRKVNVIDGAEVTFWRNLRDILLPKDYIVVPANSNGNIGYVLYHLFNRSNTEEIILCYDRFVNQEVSSTLDRVYEHFVGYKQKNIVYHRIDNYTFEWALLSSASLLRLVRADYYYQEETKLSQYRKLHEHLLKYEPSNYDEDTKLKGALKNSLGLSDYELKTFERTCTSLLTLFLEGTAFEYNKHELTNCLRYDCKDSYSCPLCQACNGIKYTCGPKQQEIDRLRFLSTSPEELLKNIHDDTSTTSSTLEPMYIPLPKDMSLKIKYLTLKQSSRVLRYLF